MRKTLLRNTACILAVLLLLHACSMSTDSGNREAVQVLDSIVVDSVCADFPVGFATCHKNGRQYVAYYNKDRALTLAARDVEEISWEYKILPTRVGWDSHMRIVLAMDREDCLHVSGNMHNDTLIYFRSTRPEDISSMERIFPMVAEEDESRCTYPSFFRDAEDCLYFSYRLGGSGRGINLVNRYDEESASFQRLSDKPVFDGQGEMSAYKSGPRLGPDGFFHVIWLWRDHPGCESNHDLSYARSRDLVRWESPDGQAHGLPITPDSKQFTVDPVAAGGGAINGNIRLFFDREMRPLIVYLKYDEAGHSQLYLASAPKGAWVSRKITDWNYRWEFSGPGSIDFEIRIGSARSDGQGNLRVDYSHVKEGKGTLVVDGQSHKLTAIRDREDQGAPSYPASLTEPFRREEGMQVRWQALGGGSPEEGSSYVLRWETTGRRRYYEPPDHPLSPSPMILYKLKRPMKDEKNAD